jgi:antitoxin MazE
MRSEIIRIGNSRGIRIPKPLLAECGLDEVVELRVSAEGLLIAPYRAPRHGWKQAFAAADPAAEPILLDRVPPNAFDNEGWEW